MKKDLAYYLGLPYNILVRKENDETGEYYFAQVLEFDGCQSHGVTLEDAHNSLREAMEGWLSVKLEHGDAIPEPLDDEQFSGKFLVRIPKTLHKKLTIEAQREGVSLNQYALYKLSR